jgi:hypothetical protein
MRSRRHARATAGCLPKQLKPKTPAPDIIQKTQAPNGPDMLDAFLDGARSLR